MRAGTRNVETKELALPGFGLHRIVIPVFIPEETGFYAQALDVLKLCLRSLYTTTRNAAAITVVANGCTGTVCDWLEGELAANRLDQLVLNRQNRGKIDAMISACRAAYEPFITFSDADVLFKPGWIKGVSQVFRAFPECVAVSPFPSLTSTRYLASATLLGGLLRRELCHLSVCNRADLEKFAASCGNPNFYSPHHYEKQMCLKRGETVACFNNTHMVYTVRRLPYLAGVPVAPTLAALGDLPHRIYLDLPADKLGYWRLSTPHGYVYHMGNIPEPWMEEEVQGGERQKDVHEAMDDAFADIPTLRRHWTGRLPLAMRRYLASLYIRWSDRRDRINYKNI